MNKLALLALVALSTNLLAQKPTEIYINDCKRETLEIQIDALLPGMEKEPPAPGKLVFGKVRSHSLLDKLKSAKGVKSVEMAYLDGYDSSRKMRNQVNIFIEFADSVPAYRKTAVSAVTDYARGAFVKIKIKTGCVEAVPGTTSLR